MNVRSALAVLLLACCAGCGRDDDAATSPSGGTTPDVETLLAEMTLEEKIGQMTQAERGSLANANDIATYFIARS